MEKLRKNKLALAIFAFAVFAVLFFSANHQDPSRPPELSIQLTKGSNLAGSLTLDRDIGCYLNGQTYTNQQVAAYQAPAGQQPTEIKAGIYLYHLPENRTINQIFAGIVPRAENKITLAYFASSNNPTNNFSTFPALPGSLPLNENSVIPANEGFLLISCKDTAAFGLKNSSQYAAALPAAFETRSGNWVLSALPQGFDNRAHNLTEFWPQRTERYADFSDPARVRVIAFAEEHNQANPYDLNAASNKLAWLKVIPTPPVVEPPTLDPEEVDAVRNGDDLNDQIYDLDANNPDNFPIPPVNPLDDFGRQLEAALDARDDEDDNIIDFIPEFENDRIVDLPPREIANFNFGSNLGADDVVSAANNVIAARALQSEHDSLAQEVRTRRHNLGNLARGVYYNNDNGLHAAIIGSVTLNDLRTAFDQYEDFITANPQFINIFNQPCEEAAHLGNRSDRDSGLCKKAGNNVFTHGDLIGDSSHHRQRLNDQDVLELHVKVDETWIKVADLNFFLEKNANIFQNISVIADLLPSATSINTSFEAWQEGSVILLPPNRAELYGRIRAISNDLTKLNASYFGPAFNNEVSPKPALASEDVRLQEIINSLVITIDEDVADAGLAEGLISDLERFYTLINSNRYNVLTQNCSLLNQAAACSTLEEIQEIKASLLITLEGFVELIYDDLMTFLVNTQNPQIFTR